MSIYGVSFDMVGKQPIVLLRTLDGTKFLPIWIGHPEAAAILMKLQGTPTPRPMTHDLVTEMLGELNASVSKVAVTELRENTFYAQITLQVNGSEIEIDSRPSDAIALAVRADAKIFVADEVIDDSAIEFNQEPEDSGEVIDEFKKFLENVTPEDFGTIAGDRIDPVRSRSDLQRRDASSADHDALDLGRPVDHLEHLGERDHPRQRVVEQPAVGAEHLAAGDRGTQGRVGAEPLGVRNGDRARRRSQSLGGLAVQKSARFQIRCHISQRKPQWIEVEERGAERLPLRGVPDRRHRAPRRAAPPRSLRCRNGQRRWRPGPRAFRLRAAPGGRPGRRRAPSRRSGGSRRTPFGRARGTTRRPRLPRRPRLRRRGGPGSADVLHTTRNRSASPASDTHAFRPVTRQLLPSGSARVVIAVASEPACGSVSENPPSASPAASTRAHRPASSAWPATAAATALCIESEKANAASPRPSSSKTAIPSG